MFTMQTKNEKEERALVIINNLIEKALNSKAEEAKAELINMTTAKTDVTKRTPEQSKADALDILHDISVVYQIYKERKIVSGLREVVNQVAELL